MEQFLQKIYTLINHHLTYAKRLRQFLMDGGEFQHRSERECEFGRLFYGEVFPQANEFPPEIRDLIVDIERLHREFHQLACQITETCDEKDLQALYHATDMLILRLTRLERTIKSQAANG
ncbi:MAG: CZB domain-containing protein [Anaerolineae bacterium]|nr:CZB domain-containing protein [Anaerolineae bacterium]MDW7991834.1 CZB domain-containing protein [Anaerolineae bacterium]